MNSRSSGLYSLAIGMSPNGEGISSRGKLGEANNTIGGSWNPVGVYVAKKILILLLPTIAKIEPGKRQLHRVIGRVNQ